MLETNINRLGQQIIIMQADIEGKENRIKNCSTTLLRPENIRARLAMYAMCHGI